MFFASRVGILVIVTGALEEFTDMVNKDLKAKEKELQAKEAELKKREQDLKRREDSISKAGIGIEEKNWPPFFPLIHHDIANEIPIHLQNIQYVAFTTLLANMFFQQGSFPPMEIKITPPHFSPKGSLGTKDT